MCGVQRKKKQKQIGNFRRHSGTPYTYDVSTQYLPWLLHTYQC